jgi:hypothetical protein
MLIRWRTVCCQSSEYGFLSFGPGVGYSDIIRAAGAIIRQSSASKHSSEKLYGDLKQENPPFEAAGFWQPS